MMFQELPFSAYPGGGREQLNQRLGFITRHADGPEFMRITGVKHCAYCGLDMTARFEDWLTMVLDHVVPVSVCKNMGIDEGWVWNYSNTVLACGACNGFYNRYKPKEDCSGPMTLPEFYNFRDRIFLERRKLILARREKERTYFETKPWNSTFHQTVLEVHSANTDPELTDWLRWASESSETPGFVRAIAEAAFHTNLPNYTLMRPVLLELKRQNPRTSRVSD
jgi:hypothetical protein